jgi:hypothetical protein
LEQKGNNRSLPADKYLQYYYFEADTMRVGNEDKRKDTEKGKLVEKRGRKVTDLR